MHGVTKASAHFFSPSCSHTTILTQNSIPSNLEKPYCTEAIQWVVRITDFVPLKMKDTRGMWGEMLQGHISWQKILWRSLKKPWEFR